MGPDATEDATEDEWDGAWDAAPPWYPTPLTSEQLDHPDEELLAGLTAVLQGLPRRHGDVLRRRLGLHSGEPETLQEIGDAYGLSRERIRQLEEGALRRIRTSLGTARQRRVDPEEHAVADRLTQAFRSLHQADRGRYLRSLLPGASAAVVARFVSRLSPATEREVVSWLAAFDEARRSEERQLSSRRRTDERWRNFVRGVVWPAGGAPAQWSNFRPCREVRVDGGEVWSPKLQRAVQYESTAEEALIRLFDDEPKVHRYCEQPLRMEYPWLDGARRYVPDLAVQLQDGRAVLVEAKPPTLWIDAVNVAKWNAATRWCALRRWGFVVTDGRRHPEDLLGGADQDDFELLESLTSDGPVPWRRFRAAWFRSGRSWPQLVAVALTHGFVLLRDGHLMVARARRSPWLDAIRDKRLASSSPGSEPRGEVLDHR